MWSDKVIQLSSDTLVSSAGSLLHRKQSQVKDYPRHRRHMSSMGYIKASSAILKAFLAFRILWCQDTEIQQHIRDKVYSSYPGGQHRDPRCNCLLSPVNFEHRKSAAFVMRVWKQSLVHWGLVSSPGNIPT